MPYNGSGVYSPVASPDFPAMPGTTIRSAAYNSQINDIASALTNAVTRDGQSPATADLPMGGFKFTGVGVPTGNGHVYRWEQLIQGADLASAAELPIPAEGQYFVVTGATTITSFTGQVAGRVVYLRFPTGITLTHSANLILPDAVNVVTVAGDVAAFISESSGVWRCISYPRLLTDADATRVAKAGDTMTGALTVDDGGGASTYVGLGSIELTGPNTGIDFKKLGASDYDFRIIYDGVNLNITPYGGSSFKFGANGHLVVPADMSLSNGTAAIGTDGNLNGTIWGGWLNVYLANQLATKQAAGNYPTKNVGNSIVFHWNNGLYFNIDGTGYSQFWHTNNFDPNSKATAGAGCQWNSGIAETAAVGDPGTVDVPNGAVCVGLGQAGTLTVLRYVYLRNQ